MCDIRYCTPDALMGETFINVGIIPGDGGAWLLQRIIGHQRAVELTFSGRLFKGPEAKELGIVLDVVPQDLLIEHCATIAHSFANKPPRTLRLTKRLMKSAQRLELADFLDECAIFQSVCHGTEDHIEALTATIETRAPVFRGV